jgi:hypothetical protein
MNCSAFFTLSSVPKDASDQLSISTLVLPGVRRAMPAFFVHSP